MRIVISGLAASYDYYNELGDVGGIETYEGTAEGLDAANGTYIIRSELEATMNVECIDDTNQSYPILVYEEEFTIYYTQTNTFYNNFDCDPVNPDVPVVTETTYERTFTLVVTKEGDHYYKVRLSGIDGDMLLSGCQVFACENNFNAETDGTLTDFQKEHNELSFPDIAGELCSDGDIWFTPLSYGSESESTVCGRGREFADMAIVGTITATLE